VRSQLSRIPGDDRKFKRLTMVVLIPACNRDRDAATSQAALAGGSVCVGAGLDSIAGVPVGVGRGVALGPGESVALGEGSGVRVAAPVCVSVGEGTEVVRAGSTVPVGERRDVAAGASSCVGVREARAFVDAGSLVAVDDGSEVAVNELGWVDVGEAREAGSDIPVCDRNGTGVDVARAATGFGSSVTVGEVGTVSVRRAVVEAAAGGAC
jgi:hypothetical protein